MAIDIGGSSLSGNFDSLKLDAADVLDITTVNGFTLGNDTYRIINAIVVRFT